MKSLDELGGAPAWDSQPRGTRDSFQGDTRIARYLRDVGRVRRLTTQEEMELATRTRNGDREARKELISDNLPPVIRIACTDEGIALPLLDLISNGNISLARAAERFDPSKGAKFSGYGALWIKQAITQALARQSKAIRLASQVVDKLNKMRRATIEVSPAKPNPFSQ